MKKVVIENKGYGYVATQNIKENTIVLTDKSVINIYSPDYLHVLMSIESMNDETMEKFSTLVPHCKDNYFYNNCNIKNIRNIRNICGKKSKTEELELFLEKYKRNAFNFDNSHSTIIPAILLNGAIFNHSCDPNISFTCNNSTMYFFTNKNINKGEELCISYVDISYDYEKRQKELLSRYGFVCTCELCTNKKNINKTRLSRLKHDKFADISLMKKKLILL